MTSASSRDRHGRGLRGPLAWPRVPVMMPRRRRFDEMVLDAVGAFEQRLGSTLPDLEVAVEDVPPTDPAPWEGTVALGRLFPEQGGVKARMVIYRRPVESRAAGPIEASAIVHEVVTEQLATMLGLDPEDLL
ncbi:MAG: metallopeptidase family protein [Ornithinimicrobium sp.]